jgi:hypothetical protein
VTQELYDKMNKHPEIDWSRVVVKALDGYIRHREIAEGATVSSEQLLEMLKDSGLDVSCVSLEKAIEYYEKCRNLE